MFTLSDISNYDSITIQCHDNPDADAIGSAFGLFSYFKSIGKESQIIYSGRFEISKANLLEMVDALSIPISYVKPDTANPPIKFGTLIITDGQYGTGNVTRFDADTVVVIDHHREENTRYDLGVINFSLGSCSTLVWDLMRKEGFPFDKNPEVSTALYYGLYSDTIGLSEVHHPLDKDMRDSLTYSRSIIKKLQNTNLSMKELEVAGAALTRYERSPSFRYAIFRSEPCDPNILGFISDLALQVDSIDTCIVYNHLPEGAKLSVRTCTREVMASDLAEFITRGVGSGGGHVDKAGGFISLGKVEELLRQEQPSNELIDNYITQKMQEYFSSYDIVDSASHILDVDSMKRYRKLKIPVGYVCTTELFEKGTPIMIRALEGDENVVAADDMYLMVGILGEVYPINAEKFNRSYILTEEPINAAYSYAPTARDRVTGEVKEISGLIKPCIAAGEVYIFAEPIKRDTKVFTSWNIDGYMYGRPGDYIVVRSDDFNDVYIIREDIFHMTYEHIP